MTAVEQTVKKVLARHGGDRGALIPVLQELQRELGWLPEEALVAVAQSLGLPKSRVFGVATFYSQFSLSPRGRHLIQLCQGTACHVQRGNRILEALRRELGLKPGEPARGGRFSLEVVRCVGCCSLAPVMVVDGVAYGRLTPERAVEIVRDLDGDPDA